MAYINVMEWRCEQVTEWLKGKHKGMAKKTSKITLKSHF